MWWKIRPKNYIRTQERKICPLKNVGLDNNVGLHIVNGGKSNLKVKSELKKEKNVSSKNEGQQHYSVIWTLKKTPTQVEKSKLNFFIRA